MIIFNFALSSSRFWRRAPTLSFLELIACCQNPQIATAQLELRPFQILYNLAQNLSIQFSMVTKKMDLHIHQLKENWIVCPSCWLQLQCNSMTGAPFMPHFPQPCPKISNVQSTSFLRQQQNWNSIHWTSKPWAQFMGGKWWGQGAKVQVGWRVVGRQWQAMVCRFQLHG